MDNSVSNKKLIALNTIVSAAKTLTGDLDLLQDVMVCWLQERAGGAMSSISLLLDEARRKRERERSAERRAFTSWSRMQRSDVYADAPSADETVDDRATRIDALRAVRGELDDRRRRILDDWGAGVPVRRTASALGISPTRVGQIRTSISRKVTSAAKAEGDSRPKRRFHRHRCKRGGVAKKAEDEDPYAALVLYAQADEAVARLHLLPILREAGLRVTTLEESCQLGRSQLEALELGLQRARRVVVLVSASLLHAARPEDRREEHAALLWRSADVRSGQCRVIPVYLDDPADLPSLPGWLRDLTGLELFPAGQGAEGTERQIARLVRELQSSTPRS